jgi:hypothetical protein
MNAKRQLLTQQKFDAIASSSDWSKVELGLAAIHATPGIQRKNDLLGVYASGDANAPKTLNGQQAILGMDVIVFEKDPRGTEAKAT